MEVLAGPRRYAAAAVAATMDDDELLFFGTRRKFTRKSAASSPTEGRVFVTPRAGFCRAHCENSLPLI